MAWTGPIDACLLMLPVGAHTACSQVVKDPLVAVVRWVKTRSQKEKLILGGIGAFLVRRRGHASTLSALFWGMYVHLPPLLD